MEAVLISMSRARHRSRKSRNPLSSICLRFIKDLALSSPCCTCLDFHSAALVTVAATIRFFFKLRPTNPSTASAVSPMTFARGLGLSNCAIFAVVPFIPLRKVSTERWLGIWTTALESWPSLPRARANKFLISRIVLIAFQSPKRNSEAKYGEEEPSERIFVAQKWMRKSAPDTAWPDPVRPIGCFTVMDYLII
ncbi:hypothetical protein METBIDRAFT_96313 [Metschnikowia bicuspidata var. bicuspidata NRRL YB-4993]|uniref:Uncharacterized protein n=1 Tax=Metschnikowia bicuspidata var. bicuspidata NRRL YB-4993 TaxID=869754 RepID=A0A1A0HG88_9ASCO|nr:hypothetical protein METBIDRAFT_96313 [Metschnikowia bicuspidata var. bicuspidata NRRL YB-4993]OBA23005.1 hypothetical protein METBIDRAFT_96313 [Metschnikowia bicuspidata var. bicuspidata NRRL YB-4993]